MNGFSNEATWRAVLWLSNDYKAYRMLAGLKDGSRWAGYALMNGISARKHGIKRLGDVFWQEVADHINEGL